MKTPFLYLYLKVYKEDNQYLWSFDKKANLFITIDIMESELVTIDIDQKKQSLNIVIRRHLLRLKPNHKLLNKYQIQ